MTQTKFKVVSDSCCDLPKDMIKQLDVDIVPLYVAFQDGKYLRDYYDFSYHDFYQRMLDHPGEYPKTSLPSVEDYMNAWEKYVKEGIPILNISMTSKMSGSYNSARMAKDELLDTYPDAQIEVVDSQELTILQGMLVMEACRLRDNGKSLTETAALLNSVKADGRAYFTIGDLRYIAAGGRIGNLVKLAAAGLGLKPVILFQNGSISLCVLTRSRQRSLKELVNQAASYFITFKEDPQDYHLCCGYGLLKEEGEEIRKLLRDKLAEAGFHVDPPLVQIGTMVGAHNGPMLMGIAFLKKQ